MSRRNVCCSTPYDNSFGHCCQHDDEIDPELCIIEGSSKDKTQIRNYHNLSEKVWANVRPPGGFNVFTPVVTARRTEIVRAQLMGQIRPAEVVQPTEVVIYKERSVIRTSSRH